MNLFIDVLIYGLLFLFVWVCSFLFHELCHIIGAGRLHGTITVDGLSMSASPANLMTGGFFSGAIFSFVGTLIWVLGDHPIGYIFVICGIVNVIYSIFETMFLSVHGNDLDYKLGRYTIYVGVTSIMLFVWMVFLR
jgi:hypothetical protein